MFLTRRQIFWETFKHHKISDMDGTVLDLSDLLKIEIKNDSLQSFDTKWDETVIAMRKHPDEEILENLHFRQLKTPQTTVCAAHRRHGPESREPRE